MAQRKRTALKRGGDAMKALKQEQEKAEARREAGANRGPFRFYVGKDANGKFTEHELIFLDEDLTQAPFAYEHTIPGPGNNWRDSKTHVCADDFDDCCLCRAAEQGIAEEFTPSRYNMYATVLDTTPYTIKSGQRAGEVIPYTKKLYVIPHTQAQQILKMAELCKTQNGGSTRGMTIVVTKAQNTDARCGLPQMLDNGMLFDVVPDEEIEEDFWNEEVRRDNKVVKAAGEDIEPYDYDEILAVPDQKVLRKLYNLSAPPGSEDEEAEETGGTRRSRRRTRKVDNPEADNDEEGTAPAATARSRRRRASTEDADNGADEQDGASGEDEGTEDPKPRRRRRRANADIDDEIPFDK